MHATGDPQVNLQVFHQYAKYDNQSKLALIVDLSLSKASEVHMVRYIPVSRHYTITNWCTPAQKTFLVLIVSPLLVYLLQSLLSSGSKKAMPCVISLCDKACKRSLAICCKRRAWCPIKQVSVCPYIVCMCWTGTLIWSKHTYKQTSKQTNLCIRMS